MTSWDEIENRGLIEGEQTNQHHICWIRQIGSWFAKVAYFKGQFGLRSRDKVPIFKLNRAANITLPF